MNNERKFRAATALLLITAMSISVYHRHKAEQIGGARAPAWQEEGGPSPSRSGLPGLRCG